MSQFIQYHHASQPTIDSVVPPPQTGRGATRIQRPSHRKDFEIAIICALPLEYNAVYLVFDEFWDESGDEYGRAVGDMNNYTTGRIGKFNVVLALLSSMGKANAAQLAAHMRSSYSGVQLVLVVGICGGVPQTGDGDEILLGDVVISKTLVQHDFGSLYPDRFIRKDTIQEGLSKPNKDIRNLLAVFETEPGLNRLQQKTTFFLMELQNKAVQTKSRTKYGYPGAAEDKLFRPSYRHKHRSTPTCICRKCEAKSDRVCDEALKATCDSLGCDQRQLVPRDRLSEKKHLEQSGGDGAQQPAIHVGAIASGDMVMKSGENRDDIAKKEEVIAFEMEGAGIWDETPCIIVKGVCDYADSHKNKKWQTFAAATAASASKAILERYIKSDRPRSAVRDDAGKSTPPLAYLLIDPKADVNTKYRAQYWRLERNHGRQPWRQRGCWAR